MADEKDEDWSFKVDVEDIEKEDANDSQAPQKVLSKEEAVNRIRRKSQERHLQLEESKQAELHHRKKKATKNKRKKKKLKVRYATFMGRAVAQFIDLLFISIVILFSTLVFNGDPLTMPDSYMRFFKLEMSEESLDYAVLLGVSLYFIPIVLYRRFLGKRWLSIRIVKNKDKQRPGIFRTLILREIIGKSLSLALFGVGFLLPLVNRRKRALHDFIAGTIVLR